MPCVALAEQGGMVIEAFRMHYVYLIESMASPGTTDRARGSPQGAGRKRYVGYTEDLKQRILDHNAGTNRSTAPYLPWRLCSYCAFSTKEQALAFEKYLKSGSGRAFSNKRLW